MATIKIHVSHDFMAFNANDAHTFGVRIINQLTANSASFTALPYSVAVLKSANDQLHLSYVAYQQGGENQKGAFVDAQRDWKLKFNKVAFYIDTLADGDEAIINLSGYSPTKSERTPVSRLDILTNLQAESIVPAGSVHISCDPTSGSGNKGYAFLLSRKDIEIKQVGEQINFYLENELLVTIYAGTSRMHDFNGLPSLTHVKVRGFGFNAAGIGSLSVSPDVSVQ